LLASLWGVPFVFLVALGLRLTSAAQVASITPSLMPVFAGLMAWGVLREPPGGSRLLGYCAIVGGLAVLVVGDALSRGAPSPGGLIALVLAAGMWAIYSLRFRRSGLTAIQAAALICFWSAILYLPIYLLFGLSRLGGAALQEVAFQAVYQGLLMGAIAVVTYNRAVTLLGPRAAAAIIALLPVVATVMAIPVLSEIPTGLDGIAIGFIAIGVIFAARPAPPQKPLSIIQQ
jgi:drug/metabolite transporter (DMT)-like permease